MPLMANILTDVDKSFACCCSWQVVCLLLVSDSVNWGACAINQVTSLAAARHTWLQLCLAMAAICGMTVGA